jgi:hypothetical protein
MVKLMDESFTTRHGRNKKDSFNNIIIEAKLARSLAIAVLGAT